MKDSCFVFIFGPSGTLGALFSKESLISSKFFNAGGDSATITAMENYLSTNRRAGIKIVVDHGGQNFLSRSALKTLKPKSLQNFLRTKLQTDLKHTPESLKTARLIKSDPGEKTDEYLLANISIESDVSAFVQAAQGHSNKIIGFYSSAAELNDISSPTDIKDLSSFDLLKRQFAGKKKSIKPKNNLYTYDASSRTGTTQAGSKMGAKSWIVSVAFLETSGLRTTVSIGNSVLVSKVKKISDRSFNETAPIITGEINSAIQYAERASLMSKQNLFMNVFGSKDFLSSIEAISPDVGTVNLFLMQDYINITKNQALAKEYNYPAALALAYKIYKKPFITFKDGHVNDHLIKENIYKAILYIGIAMFIGVNSFALYNILPLKKMKEEYRKSLTEEEQVRKKFNEATAKVKDVNVSRMTDLVNLYSSIDNAPSVKNFFSDVSQMLNASEEVSVSKFVFNASAGMPKVIVVLSFKDPSKQTFLIEALRSKHPEYEISIQEIKTESNEAVLKFIKRTA